MKYFKIILLLLAVLPFAACKKDKQPSEPVKVAVASVHLNEDVLDLLEGESFQLTAKVLPADAANKEVSWSVDNDDVASVTDGLVVGLMAGTATVTVTTEDGGKTATCTVNVEAEVLPPSAVNIRQDEYELEVGDEQDMTYELTVDGPGGANLGVEWTSADPEVAVVENNKIIAKKYGTVVLKASALLGDKYDECTVKVYDKPTGAELLRDGVELSEANSIEFEFSEEEVFEVKVLPETAKQTNWCFEVADGGNIEDVFELADMDTNTPKFKAVKADQIIRINLCYGTSKSVAKYFEFTVGPKLELTASAQGGFAGEGVTLTTNIASAEWSASYPSKGYSVYMGDHPLIGRVSLVSAPGTSSVKILPLPMFKKGTAISDAPVTVKVETAHQTAEYVVTSKAWRPYLMDKDSKQELRVDEVSVGQTFTVGLKDAAGDDILVQYWKDAITLKMGSGSDAYTKTGEYSNAYEYQFEEGAGSYKIEFIGSYDKKVKYEQDFSPTL